MPEVESLSIEETNKLRISLGLKPLTVTNDDAAPAQQQQPDKDDSSFEAQEKRAVANWTKHQEELKKKEKRERQKEEIQKAKDAMKRFKPLEGKSLGEADGADEEDAAVWVRKMKKRQRKIAHKMAEELAAREQDGNGDYTAEQLAGVKVGHDFGDLEEGGETILTLKDATIDELEGMPIRPFAPLSLLSLVIYTNLIYRGRR